jgi:hypothetical protein
MNNGATVEDVLANRDENPLNPTTYLQEASGELSQLGTNPLAKIDFARAEAMNNAKYAEKKTSATKRVYWLKKLFLLNAKKYAEKWDVMKTYPKQITQKPAWFDLALSMFKENEISSLDKKVINNAFNKLWEFRDRVEPERVMSEEESLRQYGINSPYYQQPEDSFNGLQSTDESGVTPQEYISPPENILISPQPNIESQSQNIGNQFGVRKISPREDDKYLNDYMSGYKSNVVDLMPFSPPKKDVKPQGEFNVGITPSVERSGGSGSGAFNIGRNLFSRYNSGGIIQPKMNLPSTPDRALTVCRKIL